MNSLVSLRLMHMMVNSKTDHHACIVVVADGNVVVVHVLRDSRTVGTSRRPVDDP